MNLMEMLPFVAGFASGVATVQAQTNTRIRWTMNFGHNLIREISIQFTGLPAQVFDNYFLDQWATVDSPRWKRQRLPKYDWKC